MFELAYYDREASITITNFIIYDTIKSEIKTARFCNKRKICILKIQKG